MRCCHAGDVRYGRTGFPLDRKGSGCIRPEVQRVDPDWARLDDEPNRDSTNHRPVVCLRDHMFRKVMEE
ncbi:hypothetical protein GCM10010452_36620 [Crossiella cryophila]